MDDVGLPRAGGDLVPSGCALPFSSPSASDLRAAEREVVDEARTVRPDLVWASQCADGGPESHNPNCTLGFVPTSDDLGAVIAVVVATAEAARDWNAQRTAVGDTYVGEIVPVGKASDGTLRLRSLVCRGDAAAVDLEFSVFGSDEEPTPEDFVRRAKRASCVLGPPDPAGSDAFRTAER